MTSSRPYLLRAMYDWIQDNHLTPHILVDAHGQGVRVPQEYVRDGQIVLNLAPSATMNLVMTNDQVSFSARFRGIPMDLLIPVESILGIYARENGQGMMFSDTASPPTPTPGGASSGKKSGASSPRPQGKPSLKVVK